MIAAIENYKKLKAEIPHMLDISGYRNDYVAKKIGMLPPNFSVKKAKGNWTEEEVENIMKVLTQENEEVNDYIMCKIMEAVLADPNETSMTYEEYREWYDKTYGKNESNNRKAVPKKPKKRTAVH